MFLRAASISSSMCSFLVSSVVVELELGVLPALRHDRSTGSAPGLHLLSLSHALWLDPFSRALGHGH